MGCVFPHPSHSVRKKYLKKTLPTLFSIGRWAETHNLFFYASLYMYSSANSQSDSVYKLLGVKISRFTKISNKQLTYQKASSLILPLFWYFMKMQSHIYNDL